MNLYLETIFLDRVDTSFYRFGCVWYTTKELTKLIGTYCDLHPPVTIISKISLFGYIE